MVPINHNHSMVSYDHIWTIWFGLPLPYGLFAGVWRQTKVKPPVIPDFQTIFLTVRYIVVCNHFCTKLRHSKDGVLLVTPMFSDFHEDA